MNVKVTMHWSWETDMLLCRIHQDDGTVKEIGFSKAYLEDMNGYQLFKLLHAAVGEAEQLKSPYTATQAKKDYYAEYMKHKKNAQHQVLANKIDQEIVKQYTAQMGLPTQWANTPTKIEVKELHIYDLGEGFFVPVDLACLLAQLIHKEDHKPPNIWKSQYILSPEEYKSFIGSMSSWFDDKAHIQSSDESKEKKYSKYGKSYVEEMLDAKEAIMKEQLKTMEHFKTYFKPKPWFNY